jgi:hypothetical protein
MTRHLRVGVRFGGGRRELRPARRRAENPPLGNLGQHVDQELLLNWDANLGYRTAARISARHRNFFQTTRQM